MKHNNACLNPEAVGYAGRDPRDEDSEFKEWASNRDPEEPPNVPASVTFMEMMRQAAARKHRTPGRSASGASIRRRYAQADAQAKPRRTAPAAARAPGAPQGQTHAAPPSA